PVIAVGLDGERKGRIAFEPYSLSLGYVEEGKHVLDITCFGNRVNAFGCVHNCMSNYKWFGPNAWRTTGHGWAYQYQLKPMGILKNPRLCSEE
ncbi:MAG: hypothetical protein Q8930_13610, partial [Bacillota bacterium]|nr:hypothetical protein [Bacillota bacterium]